MFLIFARKSIVFSLANRLTRMHCCKRTASNLSTERYTSKEALSQTRSSFNLESFSTKPEPFINENCKAIKLLQIAV